MTASTIDTAGGPAPYQLDGPAVSFQVLGAPIGQGRVTTFGRGMSVHSNAKTLLPWRTQVQHAAEAAIEEASAWHAFPLVGPVGLYCAFTVKKPVGAPKSRRIYPVTRPDLSHLLRAVEDALTAAGMFKDDSQLVDERVVKVYPGEHSQALHVPGVVVRVYVVDGAA